MAVELFCRYHDVLFDARRLRRMSEHLENEWNDIERPVDEERIECTYRQFLSFVSGSSEVHEHHRRRREVIHIDDDDEDDCDGEKDPQYELFLRRLKEHEKSCGVESGKSGQPVFIKYEAEIGAANDSEKESPRKMITCAEQMVELSQDTGLLNNQAAVVQHGSNLHAQSGDCGNTQCARMLMKLKRENVRGSESEPGLRTNRLMQNQHGNDALALKDVILIDDDEDQYCQLGPGNNRLVKHQSEPRIGANNKIQNPRKKLKVVRGRNLVKDEDEPDKINVIVIDGDVHIHQKPGPRNNQVKGNLCGLADQDPSGEKEKEHSQIYLQQVFKGKNVVGEDGSANRKAVVQIDSEHLHQKASQQNNWLPQYQNEPIDEVQPVIKYKEKIDRKLKGKNVVKGEHKANKKTVVQLDNENFYHGPRNNWVTTNYCERVDQVQPGKDTIHGQRELMKMVQGDHGHSNQKRALGNYAVKNESDDCVKTPLDREGINNKIRSLEAPKCSVTIQNSNEVKLEKEADGEIIPEVEILDSAAYIEQGVLVPFVPSKRFHISMMDVQDLGRPSLSDEFRKEVLKVIRKPFDKEEYNRHQEAIQAGSYLDLYPDLGKSLKKHRYKRGKCLAILRGFFYWLQNVCREGAFQPWKDRRCLAVEPPSP